jgi:hypothetical protein
MKTRKVVFCGRGGKRSIHKKYFETPRSRRFLQGRGLSEAQMILRQKQKARVNAILGEQLARAITSKRNTLRPHWRLPSRAKQERLFNLLPIRSHGGRKTRRTR